MHAWEAIQQSVDYIEEHLKEEIQTEMLAKQVSLSTFYFQRLFKRLVNKPVQEYIKLRRLARVIEEFKHKNQKILDVALDYGFSSHAHFTRTFKDTYGITPEEYKYTKPLLNTFVKPEIYIKYITIDEGVPLIVNNIVLEIQRKKLLQAENYLGLAAEVNISTQIPAGESTGIDVPGQLWNKFHKEKEVLSEYIDPSIELGMSYMADMEKGVFTYFAGGLSKNLWENISNHKGIEIKASSGEYFVSQELLKGDYIVCRIEAENFEKLVTEALYKANKYLFETWLPNHQITTKPFSAEKYFIDSDCGNYMEIWVAPIDSSTQ